MGWRIEHVSRQFNFRATSCEVCGERVFARSHATYCLHSLLLGFKGACRKHMVSAHRSNRACSRSLQTCQTAAGVPGGAIGFMRGAERKAKSVYVSPVKVASASTSMVSVPNNFRKS